MRNIRKLRVFIVTFFMNLAILSNFCLETLGNEPNVLAEGAVLMSKETGRILWGKNENTPLAMASTTKILTAIIVLENSNLDDLVIVSENASNQPKVHMDLAKDEVWSVNDLLYALMLASYNDTAVALAEFVGGTVENFCDMMEKKARELGANTAMFSTPNGLDSNFELEEHCISPEDMAIITAYALDNEKFCEIISTPQITINEQNGKRQVTVNNADAFLNDYDGAIGVKTGYTNRAGHCFVGAVNRDENTLISVVLASGWGDTGKLGKWTDTKKIMDYGFENFSMQDVVYENESICTVNVLESYVNEIDCVTEESFSEMLSEEEFYAIEFESDFIQTLNAPVVKGQKVGVLKIMLYDKVLKEIDLITSNSAKRYNLLEWFSILKAKWVDWI